MKTLLSTSRIEVLEARIAPAAVLYFVADHTDQGLFQIDPATGISTKIGTSGTANATDGLTETDNPYELIGSKFNPFLNIRADGSGVTTLGASGAEGLAFDPTSGILYGALNGTFFTIDRTTGVTSPLAAPGFDVEGLAFGNGFIYGLVSNDSPANDGLLRKYDIAQNSWSAGGDTNISFVNAALAYDPASNTLYAKGNQDQNLYAINPDTAAATIVGSTGLSEGGGLALIDNGLKIVNDKTATYTDGNGDLVTVKVTQGSLDASNFLLVPAPNGGAELWRLDLSAAEFAKSDVTVSAKKTKTGGDGIAHVGFLNGGTNDLGKVTVPGDLARVVAGDGNATKPAVAALTVGSMGVIDLSKNLGLDQVSGFAGDVGKLTIRGDFDQKQIAVAGNIGAVSIGGSIIGGAALSSGEIFASGTIKTATVGGSIIGGDGDSSGRLFGNGGIGQAQVKGAVQGGDGPRSGTILSNGAIGAVVIGKSLLGGVGESSGNLTGPTSFGALKIGGAIVGGDGTNSGRVLSNGAIASLTITESLIGGDGEGSGRVVSALSNLGPVKIGGSVIGGDGNMSGGIFAEGNLASLAIKESVVGGTGPSSGMIDINGAETGVVTIGASVHGGAGASSGFFDFSGSVKSFTVNGSIVGGDGTDSGRMESDGKVGALTLKGSLIGGDGARGGSIWVNRVSTETSGAAVIGGDIIGGGTNTGLLWSRLGSWTSVTVGGSLIGGEVAFSGGILAEQNLGKVLIKGSVIGDAAADVLIRAGGLLTVPAGATKNLAITSLTILGSVDHAQVLVGFGNNNGAVNGHVQIGDVKIGGNWSQSSITAGHTAGGDNVFGTADDTLIGAGPATIVSRIASITIGGAVTGTYGGTDHYGFVAAQIGKFKSGALQLPLTNTTTPDVIEVGFFTGDVTVREIA